ncbi:hypothetical protein QQW99_19550 [Bacillus amyloliquefaciens]|uniref:hypothetical protein n=1 Tax=Bacillus amyloliquefaciens TaxID=1390 RepID=UPI00255B8209|nr:hypothetical protein [Bacillus amyloliquefaciens]WIX31189.1 hypothetical protein QQW99_19550 [Bacillus amyloliquefaciens]
MIARSQAIAAPLPVPCTAIWSRSDGFVNGFICHDPSAEAVEVSSGHLGVHIHPEVLLAIAAALAQGKQKKEQFGIAFIRWWFLRYSPGSPISEA